jgi:proteasome lid subunit RPN8/RPN11
MFAHAERAAPLEACGYLAAAGVVVSSCYEMTNTDASEEHFSFDVKEQFAVIRDARDRGLKISAVYHSHPKTPARPSAEDLRLAHDPGISYVIISLAAGCRDVKSYTIINGTSENETLEVTDDAQI